MEASRPLREVFAGLAGHSPADGGSPDLRAALADHGALPDDLLLKAIDSYAQTAPGEVAEHLSGITAGDAEGGLHLLANAPVGDWAGEVPLTGEPALPDHPTLDDDPHVGALGALGGLGNADSLDAADHAPVHPLDHAPEQALDHTPDHAPGLDSADATHALDFGVPAEQHTVHEADGVDVHDVDGHGVDGLDPDDAGHLDFGHIPLALPEGDDLDGTDHQAGHDTGPGHEPTDHLDDGHDDGGHDAGGFEHFAG